MMKMMKNLDKTEIIVILFMMMGASGLAVGSRPASHVSPFYLI